MSAVETRLTCWRFGASMALIARCRQPGGEGLFWRASARGPIAGSKRAVQIHLDRWRLCVTVWACCRDQFVRITTEKRNADRRYFVLLPTANCPKDSPWMTARLRTLLAGDSSKPCAIQ